MSAETVIFGLTAFLVIASAMMVVVNRHPVYSALFLVQTFVGLSIFFLLLQAPFLAAVQVIVYAGAIMVLFLFVIMLLNEDRPLKGEQKLGLQMPLGIVFALCLAAEIGWLVVGQHPDQLPEKPAAMVQIVGSGTEPGEQVSFGSVKAVGNTLYTDYLFAFEATSVVLMIAMVGVVVLAKRKL